MDGWMPLAFFGGQHNMQPTKSAVTETRCQSPWLAALSFSSQFRRSLVVSNGSHQGLLTPAERWAWTPCSCYGLPNHQAQWRPQQSKCDHGGALPSHYQSPFQNRLQMGTNALALTGGKVQGATIAARKRFHTCFISGGRASKREKELGLNHSFVAHLISLALCY